MSKYTVTVPPTRDMGSYALNCRDSHWSTYRQDALIDYNISRRHEGLPPLKRMPAGTRYERITAA